MNIKQFATFLMAAILAVGMLAGCGTKQAPPPATAQPVELNISAAASMKNALAELQQQYQTVKPNVKLIFNFAASGTLQKQIEQGAPADLFISAAPKQMDELDQKNLVQKPTRKNLLENQLVLIVPKSSNLGVQAYEDLTKDSVKKFSIGEPETVPAGQYAQQVLKKIDLWDKVKDKAVLAKDVRSVLAYVETGNVEAGIVYRTDAAISDKVQIVSAAPTGSHQPIIYPAAVLTGAKQPKVAEEFLTYLSSAEAQTIFEKHGFVMSK
jgi:molybdate transport system substrate-binding protein